MSPTRIPRRATSNINFEQLEATTPESASQQDLITSDQNDSSIGQDGSADANVIVEAPHASISPRAALPEPDYITLTATHAQSTYVTTIQLGNGWHSTSANVPTPTPSIVTAYYNSYTPPPALALTYTPNPGTPRSAMVGIAVGCVLALVLLIGVMWIYWLRLHQLKRKKKSSRKSSRKSSPAGSSAPPPPPPPP